MVTNGTQISLIMRGLGRRLCSTSPLHNRPAVGLQDTFSLSGTPRRAHDNMPSEMSVKVKGEDSEAILQEFVNEYERNRNGITPAMIKNTIRRNNCVVSDYSDKAELRECLFGFRVRFTIRKTP